MSVPAHAPYDYHALEALKSDKKLQQMFHISIDDDKVSPIKIIESEANSSGIPAAEAIEQVGALAQNNNNNDDDDASHWKKQRAIFTLMNSTKVK